MNTKGSARRRMAAGGMATVFGVVAIAGLGVGVANAQSSHTTASEATTQRGTEAKHAGALHVRGLAGRPLANKTSEHVSSHKKSTARVESTTSGERVLTTPRTPAQSRDDPQQHHSDGEQNTASLENRYGHH